MVFACEGRNTVTLRLVSSCLDVGRSRAAPHRSAGKNAPLLEYTAFPRDFPGKICLNSGRGGSLANCGLARRGIRSHHHPVSAMELALDGWVAHRKVGRAGSEASEFNGKRGQAEAGGGGGHFFCPHAGRHNGHGQGSTARQPPRQLRDRARPQVAGRMQLRVAELSGCRALRAGAARSRLPRRQ